MVRLQDVPRSERLAAGDALAASDEVQTSEATAESQRLAALFSALAMDVHRATLEGLRQLVALGRLSAEEARQVASRVRADVDFEAAGRTQARYAENLVWETAELLRRQHGDAVARVRRLDGDQGVAVTAGLGPVLVTLCESAERPGCYLVQINQRDDDESVPAVEDVTSVHLHGGRLHDPAGRESVEPEPCAFPRVAGQIEPEHDHRACEDAEVWQAWNARRGR